MHSRLIIIIIVWQMNHSSLLDARGPRPHLVQKPSDRESSCTNT